MIQALEQIFYSEIFSGVNLYSILSNILKFLFVIIVLRFIYLIIRMIYLDIRRDVRRSDPSAAYLQLIQSNLRTEYPLQREYYLRNKNTIGRDLKNNVAIEYPYLSKQHALIYKEDKQYFLEDLGSANGTYLNNEKIENEVIELQNKDIVSFGDLEFLFVQGVQDEG